MGWWTLMFATLGNSDCPKTTVFTSVGKISYTVFQILLNIYQGNQIQVEWGTKIKDSVFEICDIEHGKYKHVYIVAF